MPASIVSRQLLTIESLRILTNIEISSHTDCRGVQLRRIFITEPDASGCNWQADSPTAHAAFAEPCRSQLRTVIEQMRERYNVAH